MVDDLPLNFYLLVMVGVEMGVVASLNLSVWAVKGVGYLREVALNYNLLEVSQPC